jgi:hypothetical protein
MALAIYKQRGSPEKEKKVDSEMPLFFQEEEASETIATEQSLRAAHFSHGGHITMDGPQKGSDRQRPQVTSALEE